MPPANDSNDEPGAKEMAWVDEVTELLDTKYEIPGLRIRFGLDFLLGLIPGVGDVISLGFSGLLIATMARHGASPRLVVRMLINVLVDTAVGSIPILGNLFDLFFKANSRNLRLMREYYEADKHRGSVWPLLLAIAAALALAFLAVLSLLVWGYRALSAWWAG